MNKTKYMQTDSRWGSLGYPKKPYYLKNCGCGEVAICNILIEMEQLKNYTPKSILPYCRQYADPHGNGTYWSGIPAMMRHYGLTEVQEHQTMKPLWDELAKGERVAVYLMGSRKGGSKGVKWTSSGHFVCSVAYKYENGKHWVYMKDSYSNSSLRNGWISYEDNMRNDVLKVWSGKLRPAPESNNPEWVDKAIKWAKSIAADNSWHYVKWTSDTRTHECPICRNHPVGPYHGWNCIGFAYSCLYHGAGIKTYHGPGIINNAKAEKILAQPTDVDATKIVREALGNNDFVCIKRKAGMPQNLMKPGDVCLYYNGTTYVHTFFYIGNGRMIDCTSVSNKANQIMERNALTPKVIIRYTGK